MHPYYDTSNEPDFFEEQHPATKREIPPLEVLMEQFRKLATVQNHIDGFREAIQAYQEISNNHTNKAKLSSLYVSLKEQKDYLAKQAEQSDEVALIALAHYITQKKNEQDISATNLKEYVAKQRDMYSHLNNNP